jgi:hypothetical protein
MVEFDLAVLLAQNHHPAFCTQPPHEGLQTGDAIVDLVYGSCTHAAIISLAAEAKTLPNHDLFLTRFFRLIGSTVSRMK